jgi:hypothetical protein
VSGVALWSQIRGMLVDACGSMPGRALISIENPDFEIAFGWFKNILLTGCFDLPII